MGCNMSQPVHSGEETDMLIPLTEPTLAPLVVSPETERVLRRGVERAKRDPESFYMFSWKSAIPSPCRTAFCFAGHIIMECEPGFDGWQDHVYIGRDIMPEPLLCATHHAGVTREQAERLFYPHNWPQPFRSQIYSVLLKPEEATQVLERRVEHFLRTGV